MKYRPVPERMPLWVNLALVILGVGAITYTSMSFYRSETGANAKAATGLIR